VASQQFNPGNARSGRVYNAYNCGKNNFEADRALAGQVVAVAPDAAGRAADLAGFALAAAAVMAASVGQLVDIGAGTPAGNSVYRVARRVNPGTRLVGVDHDPVVLAHLRAEAGDRAVIDADVRDVAVLLRGLDAMVDWSQPLGVMLCAVISRLAPGSLVAISHACCTGADPDVITGISAAYERHGLRLVWRDEEAIKDLFTDRVALQAPPPESWAIRGRGCWPLRQLRQGHPVRSPVSLRAGIGIVT
jgi:S-adenosyl methyltransferase